MRDYLTLSGVLPQPDYHMGFEILEHPDGFFVYDRHDAIIPATLRFASHDEAIGWIEETVGLNKV